jgi:hypothetical protein
MTRRTTPLLVLALLLSLVPAGAGADATGATIDKTGWWNRLNSTASTPAGPVTVPPPPGIPPGDLVVGAAPGEATAVTAIGIQPDFDTGATVEQFTLRITEDAEASSNVGTEGAVIVACPITEFWAGGDNGDWETRPAADCDAAAVPGERDEDGTWEFDLAPVGALWFDAFGTIVPDGVLLRPDLEETDPFQAVFEGGDSIDVVLEAQPGPEEPDPFAEPEPSAEIPTDDGLSNSGGDSIFSTGGSSSPTESFDSPTPEITETPVTEAPEETASPPVADAPETQPVASRAGDLMGNLSPLVLLGILGFFGLLLTMSYWLGPNGQPVTTIRQRGVSRALDARARATKGS